MNEDERLYEQYEDAFFALLMNRVTEANGKELMQKNEELLTDPDAAVPDRLRKRCLHTIEKSYRKAQIQKAAKKTLRTLNRVALWILIPLFMFVGVFAASETVRVKTLNYLIETFDVGTSYELSVGKNKIEVPMKIIRHAYWMLFLQNLSSLLAKKAKHHVFITSRAAIARNLRWRYITLVKTAYLQLQLTRKMPRCVKRI